MRLASLRIAALLTLAIASLAPAGAGAGTINPDHYMVYPVINPPVLPLPVIVGDQFIPQAAYVTLSLEFVMTPVDKNVEGMVDSVTHFTWWRISNPLAFGANVVIDNQLAPGQAVSVLDPVFLLNPALKGLAATGPPLGPVPARDHYVAYNVIGPPVNRAVTLRDQFNEFLSNVLYSVYLGVPAEKTYQGVAYPIHDPVTHLLFYRMVPEPPVVVPPPVIVLDEFGLWPLQLGQPILLGVPSLKSGVVGTRSSSWGRLKSLYG